MLYAMTQTFAIIVASAVIATRADMRARRSARVISSPSGGERAVHAAGAGVISPNGNPEGGDRNPQFEGSSHPLAVGRGLPRIRPSSSPSAPPEAR